MRCRYSIKSYTPPCSYQKTNEGKRSYQNGRSEVPIMFSKIAKKFIELHYVHRKISKKFMEKTDIKENLILIVPHCFFFCITHLYRISGNIPYISIYNS